MVCPYLKNKGSAVRFCLWPPINICPISLNKKLDKLYTYIPYYLFKLLLD